jgi:hypothetical protein
MSIFFATKAWNETKYMPNLQRHSAMTTTASIALNISSGNFCKSDEICAMRNDQGGSSLDASTRKLGLALIAGRFIQHTRSRRPSVFHAQWSFAICEICLAWKICVFNESLTGSPAISVNDVSQLAGTASSPRDSGKKQFRNLITGDKS